jgi:hypothetical protein
MLVLMVPIIMGMLMGMHPGFVAMFMPVMRMGASFVVVLMFMLVVIVAAHQTPPPL